MPDPTLSPAEALAAIRTLARVALDAENPGDLYAKTLEMIISACDKAVPPSRRERTPKPKDPEG